METAAHRQDQADRAQIIRCRQLLAEARHAGDPLRPAFEELLGNFEQLEKRFERLEKENLNLRIELGEVVRSLELASRVDAMTGLNNRRQALELITHEVSRADRHGHPVTVMIADIDHFRAINEEHGYNAGDDLLVELARVVSGAVRNEDACARWEGGSFLILLPETDLAGAEIVAHKLLRSVAMTQFRAPKPGIRLTVSAGLCQHQPEERVSDYIRRTSEALKRAKLQGRNRYIIG